MELTQLRERIDDIDRELVALFAERMSVSAEVAEYKRRTKMAVLDPAREEQLLNKVASLAPEQFEQYTRKLYSTILELSRSYQQKKLEGDTQ